MFTGKMIWEVSFLAGMVETKADNHDNAEQMV